MAFTNEQLRAINEEGSNIVVSAGAGSGKTAVLTERVIRKLKQGVDIDKLLILTFTNEAASELTNRIRKAIIDNNLMKQLDLIDSAYITTFDSYALSLVKKYHYLLNIGRDIGIVDSGIITIYKYKVLDNIFEEMYGTNLFDKLINDFCLKDDTLIKEYIISVSSKLDLFIDKGEYLNNYLENNYSEVAINDLIHKYQILIKEKINDLQNIYEKFTSFCKSELVSKLDDWFKVLFTSNDYDEFVRFMALPSVRFVGVSEEGLALKNELKDKIDTIKELLRFKDKKAIIDGINSTKEYAQVIIDIIIRLNREVDNYKDKYGVYEFNDISHMAIDIVRDNLEIRNEIKNYFNEIMIDEYQDTSTIQETFINYIEDNNVYMVGDIKQSIYRFRNANPYIFQEKYDRYSKCDGGIKIDLLKNFRSRKETLNNINEIFNLIMDNEIGDANYLEDHNMNYGNTSYDLEDTLHDNNMEIYNYEMAPDDKFSREEKELFIIADDIIKKINDGYKVFDKNMQKLRDIRYSDICIITDRNKHLPKYKKILEYHKIPSILYMDDNLSDNMVVMALRSLFDLVLHINAKIFDNRLKYLYVSVARSFLFGYSDQVIYDKINDGSYLEDDIIKLANNIDIDAPLVFIINCIIDSYKVYEKLTKLSGIYDNIIRIDNLIDTASSVSRLGYNLEDFVKYLMDLDKLDLQIKYNSNTSSGDAVKIMNIHKSKGLEFSLCYYTGINNKFTIKELSSNFLVSTQYGLILPYILDGDIVPTIKKDLFKDDYFKKEISEKIRLLYVSLTRCREKMIILGSFDLDKDRKNGFISSFERLKFRSFYDIFDSLSLISKYIENKSSQYTKEYDRINIRDITLNNDTAVISIKENVSNYQFKENKRYSKDSKKINSIDDIKKMEYGTSIHEILEFDDFRDPKSIYAKNLLKLLPKGFMNVYHEYEFTYEVDNLIFNGIIDLIMEYDNDFYIIDFKLKNIVDDAYLEQLRGYKKYLESITSKNIRTYLYSVIDNDLEEIKI